MNRLGYKKTALGWIPEEWEVNNISYIASVSSGGTPHRENNKYWKGDIPWITTAELSNKIISSSVETITEIGLKESSAKLFPPNTLLVAMYGQGKTRGQVAKLCISAATNQACAAIILKDDYYVDFYFQYLQSQYNNLRELSNEGSQKNLNAGVIKEFRAPIPPLAEQIKIAQILSTWDKAITQTQQLIKAKQNYFTWLIEKLINPKDKSHWHFSKLGALLTESRISGKTGADAKKITVKLYGKGVIPKSENRAGSENTKFYIRKSGQFIYSKLDFLNGAFGIIPPELDGYESTLDLPAFDISDGVSGDWLLYFFNRSSFYESQQNLAKGQRKARRINPSDLLELEIQIPHKEEQLKTVAILNACKSEIGLLKRKVEYLQKQKQGLMQKLLTGQIRVKIDEIEDHNLMGVF